MDNRNYFSMEERAARSRAAKLIHREAFVFGSIVTSERKCGKAGCQCHKKDGKGHESSYLSVKIGKTRKLIFIPRDMLKKVHAWVRSYRDLGRDIQTISEGCVQRLKQGE
jgi:hypothetical protein